MSPFYLKDARDLREAEQLVSSLGASAAIEARLRSDRSRSLGNVAAFCRWRQIGRLIEFMHDVEAPRCLH